MAYIRVNGRKVIGLFLSLLLVLSSKVALAQSESGEVPNDDGIFSYVFQPGTITFILVLILIAQLVYRHRMRKADLTPRVTVDSSTSHQPAQHAKKRYDRDEISTLLKATASSKNSGRTLEEAIRMTQAAQEDLLDCLDVHITDEDRIAHVETQRKHG